MGLLALGALLVWAAPAMAAPAPSETFTRPPPLPPAAMDGHVAHRGAEIWFATFGEGPPIILLHGLGGDADNFGDQVPALVKAGHRVIVIDSRAQGRSTHGPEPISYELMESDVIAVMDALSIKKAAIVGWSDGAILGIIMAMHDPDRETRIFAFSPDMDPSGLAKDWMTKPIVMEALRWAQDDYTRLSPTPGAFNDLMAEFAKMAETQPNYTAAQLARIHGPQIAIVDGDKEELITPQHLTYLAHTIPHARLIMLKNVGHGAPVQDPDQFNRAVLAYIDGR
ncbi:MAG TPA: alpha/beta hydrolase [Caulobacteraceae bacterium]|nr:alpha/beta hydrolase [Caulobacteraceae bacterium]